MEDTVKPKVLIALGATALVLAGCSSVAKFRQGRDLTPTKATATAKDCSKGGVGCPPTNRRQYYDQRSSRYYYFDPSTGRYYWENGDPRF
jgi:uncharacterized protein YceK